MQKPYRSNIHKAREILRELLPDIALAKRFKEYYVLYALLGNELVCQKWLYRELEEYDDVCELFEQTVGRLRIVTFTEVASSPGRRYSWETNLLDYFACHAGDIVFLERLYGKSIA